MVSQSYDAIVIGAGFGGAACAALLSRRGFRVLLLEKNSRAGGKAMTINKGDFTHELWVVISAPARDSWHERALREAGVLDRVQLFTLERSGTFYISPSGELRRFPSQPSMDPNPIFDVLGIGADERPEAIRVLAEITLMKPEDIQKLDDVSFQEWLSRYKVPLGLHTYLAAICNGVFMVPNELLSASEAIRTLQEILLRGGGVYCKGGIGKVAEALAEAVELNGGTVLMRTRVHRIAVEGGRVVGVETSRGTFSAPIVVSNAGIQPTVLKLVGEEHFDPAFVQYVKELKPSWGMMGIRYYLDTRLMEEPYGMIFSDEGYWTLERWRAAEEGRMPREFIVWYEVPSNFDPDMAPPGKQCVLTGAWCPPDAHMTPQEKQVWWDKIDEIMTRVWPDLPKHIESKDYYSTREVSLLTREATLPGTGGECIGLGQTVDQAGGHKPPAVAPLRGLFFVGTDAGGYGCGTQQAVNSGLSVAQAVLDYHRSLQR